MDPTPRGERGITILAEHRHRVPRRHQHVDTAARRLAARWARWRWSTAMLLVDASAPRCRRPASRSRSSEAGLPPIVCINKIDRPDARIAAVRRDHTVHRPRCQRGAARLPSFTPTRARASPSAARRSTRRSGPRSRADRRGAGPDGDRRGRRNSSAKPDYDNYVGGCDRTSRTASSRPRVPTRGSASDRSGAREDHADLRLARSAIEVARGCGRVVAAQASRTSTSATRTPTSSVRRALPPIHRRANIAMVFAVNTALRAGREWQHAHLRESSASARAGAAAT